jgi:hypothetical protein
MSRGLHNFRLRRLPAVAAVLVLLSLAGGAWAYFTSHGTGTASASVGSINPPSNVTGQQTGADIKITWSAATLSSGGSVQGYRVMRSDNTTICGSPTLVTSPSCTDTSVPNGTYTYTVTVVYHSWTASATSGSIAILTTPSITAKPSNPSANSAPSFSFSGGGGGSGYQCQLDGGLFTPCSSPNAYSGLAGGSHTFTVHAAQGSSTGPDATYTWTVDTSAPSITANPSNPSANKSPSFSFSHTQVTYTFKCQLDGGGFSTCTSPKSYSNLIDGSHTFQVEGVSADGATTSVASYTWLVDTTAPSGGSVGYTNGYLTSASVGVTLTQGTDSGSGVNAGSGILQRSTGTLSNGSCTGFGSFSTIATNPSLSYTDSTVTDGHCYEYQYLVSDNVGNQATYTSASVAKIDTTLPTNALSLGVSPSHAFLIGSTLYFKSDTAGSFTLVNTVSDSGSGPASATFPVVTAATWTHAAQTVSTPTEGPYTSSTYSWTSGAGTPSGAEATFTSKDNAGNTSANTVLTLTPDTTAPSGGAVSVNGTAASLGGSTSTSTSTGFTIGSRTEYTETQSASQSGLASSVLTIQSETFSNGVCGAPGSGGPYESATTISGTTNPSITTGFCYLYTLTGTDNVGNATSVKTTVKVDTTGPSSPTVSLSTATGNTFISGTTAYINPQTGKSGSFKATGSSSDAQSGISTIALPSLTGFSKGGGTLSSPFETTYEWSGAVGASGAQSVTATNGVGLTATNSSAFTLTPDTTAPSGGTVSVPARVHTTSASVTFSAGTDSGSGVNTVSGQLSRAEATYTESTDTCGSFGSFTNVSSAGPTSAFTDTTVANNKCYEYEYTVSDNVGNSVTYGPTSPVKVDTTAPKASSLTAVNGSGTVHKADANDVITFIFSENIDPSSVTAAWSVGSTPDQTVTVTFNDSTEGNGTNKPDNFLVSTAGVHIGTVEMKNGNWVPTQRGSYSFSATMHFSTVSGATQITITLNSLNGGGTTVGTGPASDTFKWTPDSAITDLAGNSIEATPSVNTASFF